jgi:hypothetical protein
VGVRVVVVAVAVLLAVAGCSGGDAPSSALPSGSAPPQSSSPPPNPPSTAATTPPPPAPTYPAAARPDTPTAAASFARYWLSVLDYATTSGDTKLLRQVANCAGCNALADGIDTLRREGGHTIGGKIAVSKTTVANFAAGRAALVDVTYNRAGRTVISASGVQQAVAPERNTRLLITLRRTNSWLVTNAQPAT